MNGEAPTTVRLVLTTCADRESAEALGRLLVERRVAACATLLPGATSMYHWEGKVAVENEVVVLLKTAADRVEALKAALDDLHPYEVPECLVFAAEDGLAGYLGWVEAETRPPAE
ncbi:MAG: divalent-cation tolerance protein CutA [Planctomycetota bacterium]|jgi:periplasmic divalent cation tolerance protein